MFWLFFSSRRRHTRFSRDWSRRVLFRSFAAAHRAGDHRALAHVARRFVQLTSLAGIGILLLLMAFGRTALDFAFGPEYANRSEERRVGKEWRSVGRADREREQENGRERD